MDMEEMREEALRRMREAGFPQEIIARFENEELMASGEEGLLRPVSDLEQQAIDKFVEEINCLPYHIIVTESEQFGTMVSILFVGPDSSDWEMESSTLMDYRPLSYVYNMDAPILSDFGTIGIQKDGDHFWRTF